MATEKDGYLPPEQQLILAAKVNRLCEVLPEDFDPVTQVADAKEIIRLLDPRLQIQRGMQFTFTTTGTSESSVFAGATNAGQVNTSIESETVRQARFNIKEYRIGGYVATKRLSRREATIRFADFWDPNADGIDQGVLEPETVIGYDPESLDPKRITRIAYTPRIFLRVFSFPKEHPLDMWKARDIKEDLRIK